MRSSRLDRTALDALLLSRFIRKRKLPTSGMLCNMITSMGHWRWISCVGVPRRRFFFVLFCLQRVGLPFHSRAPACSNAPFLPSGLAVCLFGLDLPTPLWHPLLRIEFPSGLQSLPAGNRLLPFLSLTGFFLIIPLFLRSFQPTHDPTRMSSKKGKVRRRSSSLYCTGSHAPRLCLTIAVRDCALGHLR